MLASIIHRPPVRRGPVCCAGTALCVPKALQLELPVASIDYAYGEATWPLRAPHEAPRGDAVVMSTSLPIRTLSVTWSEIDLQPYIRPTRSRMAQVDMGSVHGRHYRLILAAGQVQWHELRRIRTVEVEVSAEQCTAGLAVIR